MKKPIAAAFALFTMMNAGALGAQQPFLPFAVLGNPPSLFVNFEVAPDKEASLVEYLNFPDGFALTPISIIKGETPRLYLTLNTYAVSGLRGLLSGNRAEWSLSVHIPQA